MDTQALKEKAKNLPELPGIYMMKDAYDSIIYIGKSKNLKQRVSSYFIASKNHRPKVKRLVRHIDHFSYEVVDTELDALLLECDLIKNYQPSYNKLLKNDKKYKYLRLHLENPYPRVEVKMETTQPGKYFGPYEIGHILPYAVEAINQYYGLPSCTLFKEKEACLHYRMGYCLGVCDSHHDKALYRKKIDEAMAFLNGEDKQIIKHYEKKMTEAAQALVFEKAIRYREYIHALSLLNLKKEALAFSKKNDIGMMWLKTGKGELKFYLLEGASVVPSFSFVISLAQLEQAHTYLKNQITTHAWEKLQNIGTPKVCFKKSEIDKFQITYHFIKNREDVLYKNLSIEKIETVAELETMITLFLQDAAKYFVL
jgi:excinuclease ABC subunit C